MNEGMEILLEPPFPPYILIRLFDLAILMAILKTALSCHIYAHTYALSLPFSLSVLITIIVVMERRCLFFWSFYMFILVAHVFECFESAVSIPVLMTVEGGREREMRQPVSQPFGQMVVLFLKGNEDILFFLEQKYEHESDLGR